MAKLYFKYGVMGSSKSAEALITANRYKNCNKTVLLLTSSLDDRFKVGEIKSRAIKESMEAIPVGKDNNIVNILTNYIDLTKIIPNIIIVDECQFFTSSQIEQLFFITKMRDIPVITYGLRTDFKGELFSGSKRLLALADDISEVPTICKCGKKARMVLRKVDGKVTFDGEQVKIGDIEYESVCPNCFIKENNIFKIGDTVLILPETKDYPGNYKENIGTIIEDLGQFSTQAEENDDYKCRMYRIMGNDGSTYMRTNKSLYKTISIGIGDKIKVINKNSYYYNLCGRVLDKYENGVIVEFNNSKVPFLYKNIILCIEVEDD